MFPTPDIVNWSALFLHLNLVLQFSQMIGPLGPHWGYMPSESQVTLCLGVQGLLTEFFLTRKSPKISFSFFVCQYSKCRDTAYGWGLMGAACLFWIIPWKPCQTQGSPQPPNQITYQIWQWPGSWFSYHLKPTRSEGFEKQNVWELHNTREDRWPAIIDNRFWYW